MPPARIPSFVIGFLVLFFIYHFPEFFGSFLITALFKIGFLLIAFLIARWQGWKGLGGFGLPLAGKWKLHLSAGLVIGIVAFIASILCSTGWGFEQIESLKRPNFFFNSLPLVLLMTFFPSIAEDILTRGYLYGHLKQLPPVAWIIISAVLYVLNHIWRLGDGLPVLTYLFLLGLVLALCVAVKGSLWLALGIHWGSNIAFELSNSGLQLKTTGHPAASTWILAAVWGTLLAILALIYGRQLKKNTIRNEDPYPSLNH